MDCIDVNILAVIYTRVLQNVTPGGNWAKGTLDLSVISFNCMRINNYLSKDVQKF